MPEDIEPKMIGLEMVMNMSDLDRAQEIWDRAMGPEVKAYMLKLAKFNSGKGPEPPPYDGPVVDFKRAARELEEEEPDARVE